MSFSNFFCPLDLNQITTFHWFINNSPLHIPNYLNQSPFFFSSTRATLFLIELHNFISYLFGYFHSSILIFSIQLHSIYKHIVAYKYPAQCPFPGERSSLSPINPPIPRFFFLFCFFGGGGVDAEQLCYVYRAK